MNCFAPKERECGNLNQRAGEGIETKQLMLSGFRDGFQ